MTVITIAAGIISLIGAAFLGIPSIVPLLVIGIIIGPEILGLLDPHMFGGGFEAIIKLCVAIILFEAGLNLDKDEIKKDQGVILRLISVGSLITMFCTAIFAKFILRANLVTFLTLWFACHCDRANGNTTVAQKN